MRINKFCKGKSGVYTFTPKVMMIESSGAILNEDIEHLFLGFFRLLKISIREEVEREYIARIRRLERELLLAKKSSMYQK